MSKMMHEQLARELFDLLMSYGAHRNWSKAIEEAFAAVEAETREECRVEMARMRECLQLIAETSLREANGAADNYLAPLEGAWLVRYARANVRAAAKPQGSEG